jgi:putative 2OG-Fe(II) oxygenase
MDRTIIDLMEKGFVNAGRLALSNTEISELANLSRQTFNSVRDVSYSGDKHPDFISPTTGVEGLMRLPQLNSRIAQILDKLVSDDHVQAVLKAALGLDYKIWQVNYRKSVPGDQGLFLHQDSVGETNLCIMLGDNASGDGATLFLPGSHLVSARMKKWGIETPPFLLRRLGLLFIRLTGKAGDICFFFNRTWHGRSHNSTNLTFDVILMSFFPCGASFGFEGYGEWSTDFLNDSSETRLGRLINPSIGTQKLEDGRYKVISLSKVESVPFAISIESREISKTDFNYYKITLTISLLRFIFLFRPIIRLVKVFRAKV